MDTEENGRRATAWRQLSHVVDGDILLSHSIKHIWREREWERETEIDRERQKDRETDKEWESGEYERNERFRLMERDHSESRLYLFQENDSDINTFVVLVYGMLQLLEGSGAERRNVGIGESHTSILGNQLANVNDNSKPTGIIK